MNHSATETFHHPIWKHNCAQAIAHKWHKPFLHNENLVEKCKAFGGGRSPEGLCGALYAGVLLVNDNQKEQLIHKFKELAGDADCKSLRGKNTIPCKQCVQIMDNLLEEISMGRND